MIHEKYNGIISTLAQAFQLEQEAVRNAVLRARSGNENANLARLQAVLQKAARGEKVTVAAIGGSITQGAACKTPKNDPAYTEKLGGEASWFNRTVAWFQKTFPQAEIQGINAGIGATPSFLGTFRLQRMVLDYRPDLIFVEFSVNDPSTRPNLLEGEWLDTYESVVRRSLESGAAVVQVFMNDQHHIGMESVHRPVADHYGVPCISYHKAISPGGQHICDWELLSPDDIHPNNAGHALMATCLCSYLDAVAEEMAQTPNEIPETWLYNNTFSRVDAIYADELAANVSGNLEFHTDTKDCGKWFGTLVSRGGGTVDVTIPKGAKRIWIQFYYQSGAFDVSFNGTQTSCNTAPVGWPRPMWFRVYTGAALEADTTLKLTTHKQDAAVIMGVLIAY